MKKSFLFSSAISAGLLLSSFSATLLAPTAAAQDRDSYYSQRDSFYHEQQWRMHFFQRVKDDVEHVRASTWPDGRDEYRLNRTVDQLSQLQADLADHVYDQRDLDDVIGVLSRVVDDNHMRAQDRDMLTDDLSRLRDFREHHADWMR